MKTFPYFDQSNDAAEAPLTLIRAERSGSIPPAGKPVGPAVSYLPGSELVDAVNVSILLGRPLLVTGEPGTGKTELAHWVNRKINGATAEVLVFNSKSSSEAQDLFYRFDTLRRFQSVYAPDRNGPKGDEEGPNTDFRSNLAYISWSALGKAILLGQARRYQVELERDGEVSDPAAFAELIEFLGIDPAKPLPNHHVVLIDEIDKTPRDFPNDLLYEFEKLSFRVPELDKTFEAPADYRPVLILTSNSEKSLPDPFLRRCCYHHIEFPGADLLACIFAARVPALSQAGEEISPLLRSALEFLAALRREGRLAKLPATAEMLDWLEALRARGAKAEKTLAEQWEVVQPTLKILAKNSGDQDLVLEHAKKLLNRTGPS